MKIIYKLFIGFLLVAMLSLIAGHLAVSRSEMILQTSLINENEALAVDVLGGIEREISSISEMFQEYTRDLILKETVMRSNSEFKKMTDARTYIREQDAEWSSVPGEEVTPFMRSLMNNPLSRQLKEKSDFYEKRYGFKVFGEIFITNRYGSNVAMTGKTSDYRQDDEDWWKTARKEGAYISDILYDESAGVYALDMVFRIDDNEDFIGVMKVVLNAEGIIRFIDNVESSGIHKKHRSMVFKILDKQRRLIFSTGDFTFLEDASDIPASDYGVPGQDQHRVQSEEIRLGTGREKIISYVSSSAYGDADLGWILVVEHDKEEVFAPVTKLRNGVTAASAGLTLLGLLIGYIVATPISKNIKKLMSAADKIGQGNLDTEIDVRSKDEIGHLAQSFSLMIKNLKTTTVSRDELAAEIVEREKAEKMLYQSYRDWEDTFNIITDMITVHDRDFNIIRANKAAKKLLKLPHLKVNEVLKCFRYYHGTDCPPQGCPSCDCLKTGEPATFELFEPHLNLFIEIRAIPRFDSSKNIEGLIHIVRDITEKKKIEGIVKRAKIEWEMTVDNTSEFIVLVDNKSRILRSNKSFADFVNKPVQELIGLHISELLPLAPQQMREGMPETKIEVMTKNHEWLYLSYCPIHDEDGKFLRAVVIATDVTNLKYTEQRLIKSEEELRKKVEDLEKFYEIAIGRELRMKELKGKIRKLEDKLR